MMAKKMFLIVLLLGKVCAQAEEPQCTSRFDYEYKVVQKLVELERQQKVLQETFDIQEREILKLKLGNIDLIKRLEDVVNDEKNGGDTYVRWGRTICTGNGTELVYNGFAGGSHYSYSGSAVNYLCLPTDPLWGAYDDTLNPLALVYGAEYEIENNAIFNKDLMNHDVPCAVCKTNRKSAVMIPGRNACYDGWTKEYEGYLTAGHYTHTAASEYVCLDGEAEALDGGESNHNGILFYVVEARCGSLQCPPYVNGRELTCVVCSK